MDDSALYPDGTTAPGRWYPSPGDAPSGPILMATDGTPAGEAAFRAASVIAREWSTPVQALLVIEPLPVLVPEPSIIVQPLVASRALLDAALDRVSAQLRKLAPEGLDWRAEVAYGRPSAEIVAKARECGAQLIVLGLVHHGIIDRILDGDTALEVVRHATPPVLLAAPDWTALPAHAVFAVDFSAHSMEAARAGLRLLAEGSRIVLAHVRPAATLDRIAMWEEQYEQAAAQELDTFAEALDAPAGIRVEKLTLTGTPAAALLDLADRTQADLIVAGTRGAGLVQRLVAGSVATRLMHNATRSVLVVPGSAQE